MKDTDALVADYLKRLEKELSDLPRARRRELVEGISEHIEEARSGREVQSEAEMRTLLDRMGDPADIAAEARERFGVPPKKSGAAEVGALIMLSIGGVIVPVLGWVVGVVLLWGSDVWNRREKLIGTFGTFVVLGGFLIPIFAAQRLLDAPEPSGDPSTLVSILEVFGVLALVIAELLTIAYLARQMRQRSSTEAGWSTPSADGGYGFMRRVVYFVIAVPVVFGVVWLIMSAVEAATVRW